eukprot:3935879-Prymnesium_polylepis.1
MALILSSFSLSLAPGLTPGGRAVAATMPGVTGPFGFFDPMGLTPDTKEELYMYRESELIHGRIAMMGALGYLVQGHFAPLFDMVSAALGSYARCVPLPYYGGVQCGICAHSLALSHTLPSHYRKEHPSFATSTRCSPPRMASLPVSSS